MKGEGLPLFINDKITRRGIAKGLVSVQEDLNKSILEIEKKTLEALKFLYFIDKQVKNDYNKNRKWRNHKRGLPIEI